MTVMTAVQGIDTKAVMRILSVAESEGEGAGVDVGKDEVAVTGMKEVRLSMVVVIDKLSIVAEVVSMVGIGDNVDSVKMEVEASPGMDMLDEVIMVGIDDKVDSVKMEAEASLGVDMLDEVISEEKTN